MSIWKDIPGFDGLYKVNEDGDVYSMYTMKQLRPSVSNAGYRQFVLHKNKKQYCMPAHRAVALAFIDRSDEKMVVNHIDENKQNCNVNNLEWVTSKYNNEYGGSKAAQSTYNKYAKNFSIYDREGNFIGKAKGVKRYAKEHGLSPYNLGAMINFNKTHDNKRSYCGKIFIEE